MPTPTEQLLSRTVYATDGITTVWDFSFADGYLDPSHVKAYTTNALGLREDIVVTPVMLIGEFQLQVTPALADDLVLTIYRDTPKDAPLVDFTDESGFSEIALDTNARQAVMIAAEAIDTINATDVQAALEASDLALIAATNAAAAAATAGTAKDQALAAAASITAQTAVSIHSSPAKATPVDADELGFLDSANLFNLVKMTWGNLKTLLGIAPNIHAATAKPVLADADEIGVTDSANSFGLVKITWANIKATLDTLYADAGANNDITSLGAVTSINGGQLAGLRNRIINGDFSVWQRGTSGTMTTSFAYIADRWRVKTGSGTAWVFKNTNSPANAGLGVYYKTIVLDNNGVSELSQPVEGVRTLAGSTVTVSLTAAIFGAASQTVTVFATQYFGTGGSPSSSVTAAQNVSVLNTGFAKYAVTLTLPSLSGKTIGTNGDDQLVIGVTLPNGTYNFDIVRVQLESGSVATTFEQRPYGMELMLCQRYAQIVYGGYGGSTINGNNQSCAVVFPVPMRAAPSVTWLNTEFAVNFTATTPTFGNVISHGLRMLKTAVASGQDAVFIERLLLTAEL